ncbi:MAG: PKD domain-containing protein, partial [Candidatus Thermoplasmatota archaeon]|nr:PKD domain-containing protein [Candidatus Thermoplasmatota archaeon]
ENIYITGSFGGSATFGKGESCETVLVSDGSDDIFLAKHNPDGTIAWAKHAGGTSGDAGLGIVALSDGSTIVTGYFGGSATFGKGESCETVLVSDGSNDIFVAKYNPDGTIAWGKRAGGMYYKDAGLGIVALSDGSTIVTGYFSGIADFGPYTLTSQSQRYSDVFVAKLSDDGGNFPPNTPSKPSGPSLGNTGTSLTFSTSATDPDGDAVKYGWDWGGDGTVDEWSGLMSSGSTDTRSHTWIIVGTYTVQVKAEDSNGGQSTFSSAKTVVISDNNPPNRPACSYDRSSDQLRVSATDPDGDQIKYGVDWDNDGTVDQWTGLVPSGTQQSISCGGRTGTAAVVAEDEHGAQSDWVSIKSKNKPYINTPFLQFLENHQHMFPLLRQLLEL